MKPRAFLLGKLVRWHQSHSGSHHVPGSNSSCETLSGIQLLLMLKPQTPRPGCREAFGHVSPCGILAESWDLHSVVHVPWPLLPTCPPAPRIPGLQVWQERNLLHEHLMNCFHGNLSWLQPVTVVL